MSPARFSSREMLPTAGLMAGWQGCCYVTLMAVLSAFLYFGGNSIQYGSPPSVVLPQADNAYENSFRRRFTLTLYLAPVRGERESASPGPFGCFVWGVIDPLSTEDLRAFLGDYARLEDPSWKLRGINGATGLSENLVSLSIDARCRASDFIPLLELLRDCGIWRLRFNLNRDVWP